MKMYKLILFAFCTLFLFNCSKETENLSRPTYYMAFEIIGDNPAIVQVGEPYVDAGVRATMNGQAVTNFTTKSNVDFEEMGLYQVEYSGVNADGLPSKAVRDVIVCNPAVTTDLSGVWDVDRDGTTFYVGGALNRYYGGPGYTVTITRVAPGFFYISDYLAGFWPVNQARGPAAATFGYFGLNADNSIDALSSNSNYWGEGLYSFSNGFYDDSDEDVDIISYSTNAVSDSYVYNVTLTKGK